VAQFPEWVVVVHRWDFSVLLGCAKTQSLGERLLTKHFQTLIQVLHFKRFFAPETTSK
jgi:hypothetical protein